MAELSLSLEWGQLVVQGPRQAVEKISSHLAHRRIELTQRTDRKDGSASIRSVINRWSLRDVLDVLGHAQRAGFDLELVAGVTAPFAHRQGRPLLSPEELAVQRTLLRVDAPMGEEPAYTVERAAQAQGVRVVEGPWTLALLAGVRSSVAVVEYVIDQQPFDAETQLRQHFDDTAVRASGTDGEEVWAAQAAA